MYFIVQPSIWSSCAANCWYLNHCLACHKNPDLNCSVRPVACSLQNTNCVVCFVVSVRTPEETQFQKEVREGVCRLLPQTAGEFQDMMDMCSYKKVKLSSMVSLLGIVHLLFPTNANCIVYSLFKATAMTTHCLQALQFPLTVSNHCNVHSLSPDTATSSHWLQPQQYPLTDSSHCNVHSPVPTHCVQSL